MEQERFLLDRLPANQLFPLIANRLLWPISVCFFVFASWQSISAQPNNGTKSTPLPKQGIKRYESNVFPLSTTEVVNNLPAGSCGSLARELIRQALLVCAREEFGLKTLDGSIGELVYESDSPEAYPFQLNIRFDAIPNDQEHFSVVIELSRPKADGEWFNSKLRPVSVTINDKLESIAEQAEGLSRNQFVDVLRAAGFEKVDTSKQPQAAPAVADGHFDSIAQFVFLRQIHAERQAHHESPQYLAALARGYANLGSLIDYHWSPASKAYRARSLIYANRLLAKYGRSPYSQSHRAYARALTGTHLTAIKDIDATRDLNGEPAPAWLPLIKAFCEYDPKALEQVTGADEELALYLRMRQMDPHFDKDAGLGVIEDFLRVNPSCFRSVELMCEMREIGLLRSITEGGADRMWPQVYARLTEAPDLPTTTLALTKKMSNASAPVNVQTEHRIRTEVIADLQRSGDDQSDSELSWRALAELLDDASFIQTWRVVDCERNMLAVPSDRSIQRLYPLVKRHRLAPCIQCYSSNATKAMAAIDELSKSGDAVGVELPSAAFAVWAYQGNPNFYRSLVNLYVRHVDNIYSDLLFGGFSRIPEFNQEALPRLVQTCPHQPRVVGWSIWAMPDLPKEKADEFEAKYADNGYVMLMLGQKQLSLGRIADGERCLLKSIEVAPTYNAFFTLANEYRDRGDDNAAIATYEKALEVPSYGLEKSNTHAEIAYRLMHQGKWEEANKHALEAANSYSGNGLLVAARCAEGLEEWDTAEQFYRAIAERYETSCDRWLHYCVRRNRGDRESALALCRAWWKGLKNPYTHTETWSRAIGAMIEGDPKMALNVLTDKNNKWGNDVYTLLVASLIAEKLGDTAVRDACYQEIDVKFDPTYPLPTLVHLFRSASKSDRFQWNRASFDELIDYATSSDVSFAYYCAGMFVDLHGEHELAIEYLQTAATAENVFLYGNVLACQALNDLKIPVGETRVNNRPDEWIPSIEVFRRAQRAYREHRPKDSIALYEKAYEMRPGYLLAKINIAEIQIEQKDYENAIKNLDEVLKKNPDCEKARDWLVEIYAGSEIREFQDGPKALEHAQLAFDRRSTKTWFNYSLLAAAHAACKEFDKAIPLMEEAIKLNPKEENLKVVLAGYREGKPYWSHKKGSPD